ncbi:hypothetical protein GCM10007870_06990 [Gluconobacter kondonii]|uniref:Uncharacterized protein n=1 Tax=Gluconobacter kondonii TaxID=941463 RepID=A0ABQ5WNU9_9PROT|nr:hypothetical protein AA3266_1644 [Gluconobacter kondonii NBRC 3266]GLQ65115.1 hypothetical protein GCM10007870_06990 [Gluconobacter kondonii]
MKPSAPEMTPTSSPNIRPAIAARMTANIMRPTIGGLVAVAEEVSTVSLMTGKLRRPAGRACQGKAEKTGQAA